MSFYGPTQEAIKNFNRLNNQDVFRRSRTEGMDIIKAQNEIEKILGNNPKLMKHEIRDKVYFSQGMIHLFDRAWANISWQFLKEVDENEKANWNDIGTEEDWTRYSLKKLL